MTRPVEMVFNYLGSKPNPMKKGQLVAGFTSQFSLDRWSIRWAAASIMKRA